MYSVTEIERVFRWSVVLMLQRKSKHASCAIAIEFGNQSSLVDIGKSNYIGRETKLNYKK